MKNSALTSTGLVPFMERYSNSTREVAQDGRRGALMMTVSIKHPDAEDFIDAKMVEGKVTGANVSVKSTMISCMRAAVDGVPYRQQYPSYPTFRLWKRRLMHMHCGQKLCTTHGRAPSLASFSGIPCCVSQFPTVTPTSASRPCRPTLAARFRSAPTTAVVWWLSISTAM